MKGTRYKGHYIDIRAHIKDGKKGVARMDVVYTYSHVGKRIFKEQEVQVRFLGWSPTIITPEFDYNHLVAAEHCSPEVLYQAKQIHLN